MGTSEEEVVIDLSKMRVPELKKELQVRNLKVTGNKQELIERLQNYLEEHEGAEVADDEYLKDDEGDSILADDKKIEEGEVLESAAETVSQEPEVKEASQPKPEEVKVPETKTSLTIDSKSPSTDVDKKAARAKKFGITVSEMSTADRKKAREQRFGLGGGTVSSDPDKLKRRAERFGASLGSPDEEKKKMRLQKFGSPTAGPMDEKKKKRAERFGISVA